MRFSALKTLPATLFALATAVGCGDSTPVSQADASVGIDAGSTQDAGATTRADVRTARADARVMMTPDAARPVPDGGRGAIQPRDAGMPTADAGAPYTPPSGDLRIGSLVGNRHCFSYWDEPNNPDDLRVYLTPCIEMQEGAGNQSWQIRPVPGRPGAVTIRSLRDGWDENSGCIVSDDPIQLDTCNDQRAIWNVRRDPDTNEIQLSSQDRPTQCLNAPEGEWAELAPCANDVNQFFATRPYSQLQ